MQLTTFGFEFEVETEAIALTRHLYHAGLVGMPQMCGWHCQCDFCQLGSGFLFRAQTDSSCSGEIISDILHHDPHDERHSAEVFALLQNAAVEVDAEPGPNAGLHVHVGIAHLSGRQMDDALWAYLRYEPLLIKLAAGRFDAQRCSNDSVTSQCSYDLRRRFRSEFVIDAIESIEASPNLRDERQLLREMHAGHDRHSNLNIATGKSTWEFRLWNSTRAAWRMEMLTRLSVALVDPDVNRRMLATDLTRRVTRTTADRFAVLLHDAGHERCAELVDRQATYRWNAAILAPSTLTCF